MSIDVNVTNDLVIVTESSEDISVNVSNAQGPAGQGVPVGGTAGQVLKKLSNTNYDTFWTLDGVGVPYTGATGDVNLGAFNLTATSIIKSSGTSSQFLKADGSVDSTTYQPLLTNPVTGTGTTNFIPKWTSSSVLGNSIISASNTLITNNFGTSSFFLGQSGSSRFGYSANSATLAFSTLLPLVLGTFDGQTLSLGTNNNENLRISVSGNTILQNGGTFTDGGQRLQVQGDAFIKGSGATSGTNALLVQNSSGTNLFKVKNDGSFTLSGSNGLFFSMFTTNGGTASLNGSNAQFFNYTTTQAATSGAFLFTGDSFVQTSAAVHTIYINKGFLPTSGNASFSNLTITPSINQTGGANGITRGLYVNPDLTAAADWRSIEWSNNSGWGLYGAGTANNYLNGGLLVGTTTTVSGYKLVVSGSIYASTHIRFDEAIRDNRDNTIISQSLSSVVTNRILSIGNGTYLNINFPNGNVLVGTTTDAGFKLDVNGTARVSGDFTIADTKNIILATGTGTKIGTATSQKLSFWNATPIVQPTTAVAEAAFVENLGGSIVNVDSTFDGYTMQQVVKALRNMGALA